MLIHRSEYKIFWFSDTSPLNSNKLTVTYCLALRGLCTCYWVDKNLTHKKQNKQSNENKEIIHFFYKIALFILFSIWKWSAHFVFEAFRIQVAVQSKLKTNKQKKQQQKKKTGETSYIVFYDRSFTLRCWLFFWSKYWLKVILLTGNCCGQHKLKKQ